MQSFFLVYAAAAVVALVAATIIAGSLTRFGFPLPPDDRRIGCIDGLRGYLALSVTLHHFFIWVQLTRLGGAWTAPSSNFVNQLGAGAVALFFMTTGLVFYPRILAGLRATSWTTVYITRAFRIMPLVIFSVAIITLIIALRTGARPDLKYLGLAAEWVSTWREPPLLGYPDSGRLNAYVLWSLWYEWIFYLCVLPACAALMDLVRRHGLPTYVVPLILLFISALARLMTKLSIPLPQMFIYLPLFAIGMLAFECRSWTALRNLLVRPAASVLAVAALLIGMISAQVPYGRVLPLFGFFFLCVACGNSLFGLLRTRGALVLGECSFGIYLLHGTILSILFVDMQSLPASLTIAALPTLLPLVGIAIALITPATYLMIERPAMRVGKSIARSLERKRLPISDREIAIAP